MSKDGLDYFSFDVDFFNDGKIEFVSAKYGLEGEAIVIRLLTKIYRNGYYIEWGDDESLLLAKNCGTSQETIEAVIKELVYRKFFDETLYKKYSILTSNGIQKRYLKATYRRLGVSVFKEYLIADISGLNVNILTKNDNIPKQSKVKESKVNTTEQFNTFWGAYPKKRNKGQAEKSFEKVAPDERLMAVILTAVEQAKKSAQWLKDDGQFIPYPSTWLNAKGWEDEYEPARRDDKW